MIEPITDEKLAEFDAVAHDDRCGINMYYYKKIRERLRLAEEATATWRSWAEQRAQEVEVALKRLALAEALISAVFTPGAVTEDQQRAYDAYHAAVVP